MTLIARGLTVLAGGCRYPTSRGEGIQKWCDECLLTDAVEYAILEWVDWFNHRRLLEPIGYMPPVALE